MTAELAQSTDLRSRPVPFGITLAYASGGVVDSIVSVAVGTFLFFYVTAIVGVPPGLAGGALAAGLVVDAFLDPIIGSVSDGWRSRFGRRLPMMLLGLPMTAAALCLIFALPEGLNPTALFAYLTFLSIMLRVSLSLFSIPYQAVAAELTDDSNARSGLMAWRFGVGLLGSISTVVIGFAIFFTGEEGTSRREAYAPYAATVAGILFLLGALACWAVLATRDRQHVMPQPTGKLHERLGAELWELARNPSFRALFISALLLFSSVGLHGALNLHAANFYWRLTPQQIQLVALALPIGMLFGAPLIAPALKLLEKGVALGLGVLAIALALTGPALLRELGILHLQGDAVGYMLAGLSFAVGVVLATATVALGAALADAVDEHEYLFGARREGIYFAAYMFAIKAAGGVGALGSGILLELIKFPSGVSHAENLPASTLSALGLAYGPGAGLLAFVSAGVCLLYRLSKRRHAEIVSELRERRVAAAQASPS